MSVVIQLLEDHIQEAFPLHCSLDREPTRSFEADLKLSLMEAKMDDDFSK